MRIAFLAGQTIHTVRWVNELALRGYEVHLITMHPSLIPLAPSVKRHCLPVMPPFGYYLNLLSFKKLMNKIRPHVLHAHYVSGYGTLARLSNFHPYLLSVWGGDIFLFPKKSKLNSRIVKKNLLAADQVASTSVVMKKEIEALVSLPHETAITPFGVDCAKFIRESKQRENGGERKLTIGTIKGLYPVYGVDKLIRAFAQAKAEGLPPSRLIIGGTGPQLFELIELARKLKIAESVEFIGGVSHATVPVYLNKFDIFAALSISESFGVSIIEASACELPVIVSDAPGLAEVVKHNVTGFVIPNGNIDSVVEHLKLLAQDEDLRLKLGNAGRQLVLEKYEWSENADRIEILYTQLASMRA